MLYSSRRKVKIVCTLGPATSSLKAIENLIIAGMDVARLNFSHGTHDFHAGIIKNIREASKRQGKNVAIMQDLQGPKLRLGNLEHPLDLQDGDHVLFFPEGQRPLDADANRARYSIPVSADIIESSIKDIKPNARILIDDGKVVACVVAVCSNSILTLIENGGTIKSHKGVNLPGTPLRISCMTDKDVADLKFGLMNRVDAVALSFVRTPQDVTHLRGLIEQFSGSPDYAPLVVSKIEREEAIFDAEQIVEVSDVLLIARGDMAVEIGPEHVPTVQKRLIHMCNRLGVPVITATQMLESMIETSTPTRAEASDVANAVYDGTDCVMLSGETAQGKYPIKAVDIMAQIVVEAERFKNESGRYTEEAQAIPGSTVDAISRSARTIAEEIGAVTIAVVTHTGNAARSMAKFRPNTPIVAILESEAIGRRLQFVWGVHTLHSPQIEPTDDTFKNVSHLLRDNGWADPEDLAVITAGLPTLRKGTTNSIKVQKIAAK